MPLSLCLSLSLSLSLSFSQAFSKKCVEKRKEWLTHWLQHRRERREEGLQEVSDPHPPLATPTGLLLVLSPCSPTYMDSRRALSPTLTSSTRSLSCSLIWTMSDPSPAWWMVGEIILTDALVIDAVSSSPHRAETRSTQGDVHVLQEE